MFNVAHLYRFYGDPPKLEELPQFPFSGAERADDEDIEDVVDVQATETRRGLHRRYFVHRR